MLDVVSRDCSAMLRLHPEYSTELEVLWPGVSSSVLGQWGLNGGVVIDVIW